MRLHKDPASFDWLRMRKIMDGIDKDRIWRAPMSLILNSPKDAPSSIRRCGVKTALYIFRKIPYLNVR
jgi:hypothetical protein